MRKILMETQNNGKALEVRLEKDNANYRVVLAGMTYNLNTGCAGGVCGDADTFMYIDNETYLSQTTTDYREAVSTFDTFRKKYLNDPV